MQSLFGLLVLLALAASPARAQQARAAWRVLIEPAFMHPEVSFPIQGAQRTVLVPAHMDAAGEPHYIGKKDWEALGVSWDDFRARAAQNATDKKLRGELVRDSHKVIRYAEITSDNPLTATSVLSPEFAKRFKDLLGTPLIVAIPNRYTLYVFPALASDYRDASPLVLRAYHDSTYPVSTEVFEISPEGMQAVGVFDEP